MTAGLHLLAEMPYCPEVFQCSYFIHQGLISLFHSNSGQADKEPYQWREMKPPNEFIQISAKSCRDRKIITGFSRAPSQKGGADMTQAKRSKDANTARPHDCFVGRGGETKLKAHTDFLRLFDVHSMVARTICIHIAYPVKNPG